MIALSTEEGADLDSTLLSVRARELSPSATLALDARVKEMVRRGEDVISLAVGEPDFDTPAYIKAAAVAAIAEGFTKYTAPAGIPELRSAIAGKLKRDNGLDFGPEQVVVSSGAKQASYNALLALCGPGDEVIVPAPYWVSYVEQVKLIGAAPVVVECGAGEDFKLTPAALRGAATPRARAVIINSPCNPTGAVYSRAELEGLAAAALELSLWVVSDEIYEKLVYDGAEHVSIAALSPEIKRRTVVINGLSKAYAMTGWRVGYAAAEPELARAMADIQGHVTSHATSIAQRAAVAALTGGEEGEREIGAMVEEFDRRRNYAFERLAAVPGFSCRRPRGAFYLFPDVTGLLGGAIDGRRLESSADVAMACLALARVGIVPGEAFGAPGYLRLSYALSRQRLAEALDRVASFAARVVEGG